MRMPAFALVLLALGAAPASASGGLGCEIDDKAVKLTVESGVSRGMGGALFEFKGSLQLLAAGIPADFREIALTRENLTQNWLSDKELKLVLYRERAEDKPHGYVMLTVDTKPSGDEGSYTGRYTLVTMSMPSNDASEGRTATFRGRVACFAE